MATPAKKKKRRVPARHTEEIPMKIPVPPQPEPIPAKVPSKNMGLRIRLAVVVLAIGAYFYVHHHTSEPAAPGAAAAPASAFTAAPIPPEWGGVLDLKKISSFDVRADTSDFWVSAGGEVIVLAGDGLEDYVNGDLSHTAAIGAGPNEAMACNGNSIYVTDSDNNYISRYHRDFTPAGGFNVPGAVRLLGMTWSNSSRALFVSDVAGQTLYKVSPSGEVLGKRRIDKTNYTAQGFAYDVSEAGDRVVVTDIYNGCIRMVDDVGKGEKTLSGLCGAPTNRRPAMMNNMLYVPCEQSGVVIVVDAQGRNKGYLDIKGAPIIRAGHDGCLYIFTGDEISKYKPI
ncbi:MAG TPA: hypothetical protein VK914_01035 [bacterium]|nr:hypothetical protein [bacterium]